MHEITLFAGITPRKGFFLFDVAPTREIEFPWRQAKKSLLIHFWPGKALVLGRWRWSGLSEEQALLQAVEGENVGAISESNTIRDKLRAAGRGLQRGNKESPENVNPLDDRLD